MTRSDLIGQLLARGYFNGHWLLADALYQPLAPAFVLTAHGDWVQSLPPELRTVREIGGGKSRAVPKWIAEVYDCDNHAASFGAFLCDALALDTVRTGRQRGSCAAGWFDFLLMPGDFATGHARNWFFSTEGNVVSFDAGLGDFTQESTGQLATIFEGGTA